MNLHEKRKKVAIEMGYTGWDNLIELSCQNNTPQVIFNAEVKVNTASADNSVLLAVPDWYKKDEMYAYLRRHNYSKEIAAELSQKWADDLQGSFRKGFEKGVQYESGRNVDCIYKA